MITILVPTLDYFNILKHVSFGKMYLNSSALKLINWFILYKLKP